VEIFTCTLTAVLFWLFLAHCTGELRDGARRRAGPLLRAWTRPLFGAARIALLALNALLILFLVTMSCQFAAQGQVFMLALQWFNFALLFRLSSPFLSPGLEFREGGILQFRWGARVFLPWTSIQCCTWAKTPGQLEVQTRRMRHALPIDCIPAWEREEARAILCRYVKVRDAWDKVLNPEFDAAQRPAGPDPDQLKHYRFQFDLRTLLFFFLVASAAMSWYGIRYRRDREETAVLAELERFRPAVKHIGDSLWLDFSASTKKPGDRDLETVSKLSRLHSLDLSGAPITDAGLEHLKALSRLDFLVLLNTAVTDSGLTHLEKLTSLRYVYLNQTAVTAQGVQRLQRALPKANISH
jgi:hypothetical protein